VDAAEIWLWQAGAPLQLSIAAGDDVGEHMLGPDLAAGEVLQGVVPVRAWQAARSLGAWSLVSCVVAPAFEFSGFELAAPGWSPHAK
jgi:predicted cupin superfamily sugar epimerase